MKYATAAAFRTALEQRIKNQSRETGLQIGRLRKLVVFERVLARLSEADPDRWIVKGATALDLRFESRARPTNDLDLHWTAEPGGAFTSLERAQTANAEDHFDLALERTQTPGRTDDFAAVRFRVHVSLANRPFETVTIDIGFDSELTAPPEALSGPGFLTFAGIEPVRVLAYPLVQHVAEKVHAYSRTYARSRPSSRVKDLVDLVIICSHSTFLAGDLLDATRSTFASRATHPLPARLPAPPDSWSPGYRRLAEHVGIDRDVTEGYAVASGFLDPVLGNEASRSALWNPHQTRWYPGG